MREGSLEAPTRHPLDWQSEAFYDEGAVDKELERIFEICHGCRRCVNLCTAFPTLFDLIDASSTLEVDGVAKADYRKVVDQYNDLVKQFEKYQEDVAKAAATQNKGTEKK